MSDPFRSIDLKALGTVSGGVVTGSSQVATQALTGDPLMNALTQLATELQTLVQNQQQSPFQQMMQQYMTVMMTNAFAPRPTSGKGS